MYVALSDMIYMIRYDMMIYLTAIGLTPGGSSTVHIYTQTTHRTTQSTQTIHRNLIFIFKFNIHETMHRSMTSSNNQQDAT